MDSFFARNRLSAYLDRTLPKAEAESVAEAVARDMALSADLRAMKQALTLLHDQGRVRPPNGFKARTIAAMEQQPVPGSQVAWLHRRLARVPTEWVALVGAALVIVIAISARTPDSVLQASPSTQPKLAQAKVQSPSLKPPPSPTSEPKKPQPVNAEPVARTPIPVSTGSKTVPNVAFNPSSPMGFRILHGGDQVLYDIATLADETGGRLVDVHGKLVTPHSLNEARSFTQLYLVTPANTAADAHKKLLKRSGMEPYPLDGPKPPLAEDEAVFLIEAQL